MFQLKPSLHSKPKSTFKSYFIFVVFWISLKFQCCVLRFTWTLRKSRFAEKMAHARTWKIDATTWIFSHILWYVHFVSFFFLFLFSLFESLFNSYIILIFFTQRTAVFELWIFLFILIIEICYKWNIRTENE